MKKILLVLFFVSVLGGLAYWFFRMQPNNGIKTSEVIKIGIMMPFSGDARSIGYGVLKGVQLASKDSGDVNIELIQEDSQCDKKLAPTAFENLVKKGVIAVIGEGCSGASLAALPLANKYHIVLLSPVSSSPDLSIQDDYFFRVVPPDTLQGSVAASYVYKNGKRKAAIFYSNESYGIGLTTAFRENFTKLGGIVVTDVPFERDIINLQKEVATIKASSPDVVYIVSNSLSSASAAIRLLREQGVTAMIFGSEALGDNSIIKDAGQYAEGVKMTSFPLGSVDFKRKMKSAYGTAEGFYGAAQGFDAYKALALAIDKGANTGEKMKKVLTNLSFTGVSGNITFNTAGEVLEGYTYDILEILNGKFVPVK